jgi:DNA mismatch endonuclease (patch repair protein)
MTDVVDRATRSRMMSGIRARDTKPEIIVRKYLHAHGFRYRIAPKGLPGKPDIVLSKYHTVVFVHGCFWHGHSGCDYFVWPRTRHEFWRAKINSNRSRDRRAIKALLGDGWRVGVVWECETRKTETLVRLLDELCDFIRGSNGSRNIGNRSAISFREFGERPRRRRQPKQGKRVARGS